MPFYFVSQLIYFVFSELHSSLKAFSCLYTVRGDQGRAF